MEIYEKNLQSIIIIDRFAFINNTPVNSGDLDAEVAHSGFLLPLACAANKSKSDWVACVKDEMDDTLSNHDGESSIKDYAQAMDIHEGCQQFS